MVVSILAMLVAILLPSLARAREQARRAVCAANQRQVFTLALVYASDNGGRFISTNYMNDLDGSHGETNHISWINRLAAHDFVPSFDPQAPPEAAGTLPTVTNPDERLLYCPNRLENWRRDDRDSDKGVIRTGYYFMFGHYGGQYPGPNRWMSPVSLTSAQNGAQATVMGDIIEMGTNIPAVTSASHGPIGPIDDEQVNLPTDLDIDGGNLSYIDGSTRWTPLDGMKPHQALRTQSVIRRGWW